MQWRSRPRRSALHRDSGRAPSAPHRWRPQAPPLPLLITLSALALHAAGCSRRPPLASWPAPRPLAAEYASPANPATRAVLAAPAASASAGPSAWETAENLTLGDALALALRQSPSLAACAHEVAAAEARALQDGLWRNPEIGVRRDRLWPTGDESSTDEPRTRIVLSQFLELGRAPARRRALAYAESESAAWDCEARRLQVAAQATEAFASAVGAGEKLARLREARDFVREIQSAVIGRVANGDMPERRLHQMTRHTAAAEIALKRGETELAAARQRLAATWGGGSARFGALHGRLEPLPALPDSAALRAAADQSPAVARWQSEIARARAQARLAGAAAWPEVRLDAGMRREEDTGVRSYLLGFELPLPLFDRAQGDRRAARHALASAQAAQAAARAETAAEIMTAHQELAAAHFAARTLQTEILPAAAAEFAALQQGYAENAVGVADLLDGARDLTRAQLDHLDALVACWQALAELEGLTGQPLAPPRR